MAIVVPLVAAIIVNILIVICIVVCYRTQYCKHLITNMSSYCRAVRYRRPRSQASHSNARSEVTSATELTLNLEQGTDKKEAKGEGETEVVDKLMKRQSTISQQNEAYGIVTMVKRDNTISQQNMAYGVVKSENVTTVSKTDQSDTLSEKDEGDYDYIHMRFQKC